uniref:C-type lectin domain-containing protein n=1 Tax=Plectus sambesii TaxID=2011161 RepID=A0A914VBK5_9BILA
MAAALNSGTLLLASLVAIGAQFLEPNASQSLSHNQTELDHFLSDDGSGSGEGDQMGHGNQCCPSGWLTYLDSCYLYVRERRPFKQAENFCFQRQSTLFVVNTLDELDAIKIHSTAGFWTWIGLRVVSTMKPIRPTWATPHGMDPDLLPWLNKQSTHGWTASSSCVSFYQPFIEALNHVTYVPCTFPNYFICELNATEIALPSNSKAPALDPDWWWN